MLVRGLGRPVGEENPTHLLNTTLSALLMIKTQLPEGTRVATVT